MADTQATVFLKANGISYTEHEYEYAAGTTTLPTFTIDHPGLVTVESHTLEKTIVQLEVK